MLEETNSLDGAHMIEFLYDHSVIGTDHYDALSDNSMFTF